jgi:hypothetical protein
LLKTPSACGRCKKENGDFYCGLSPSEKTRKEQGHIIGGHLMKETEDAINQYHNAWCSYYYIEWINQ